MEVTCLWAEVDCGGKGYVMSDLRSAVTGSMYLALPVPMRHVDGRTLFEAQGANRMDY